MKQLEKVMQTHCTRCGGENYGPSVFVLSSIGGICHQCGEKIKPMTSKQYRKAIKSLNDH